VVVANVVRGAFEYQGQKCSAASRLYVPVSVWRPLQESLLQELPKVKVGPVEDLSVFMGALISEEAFSKVVSYSQHAKEHTEAYQILYGGEHDSSRGWFVQPTIIVSKEPESRLMTEEVFGPVLTVYVYPDEEYEQTLKLCDQATPYALTGSIIAQDREAIVVAERALRFAAGNFYINDKPTGAIVGRQPFGGARRSGTNDKAGSWVNLTRWMSPRTIKENSLPARMWPRPYMG
jgi:1-pyrroline-5-carboxylate dehydrogenase